jgi:HEAT repeat protein
MSHDAEKLAASKDVESRRKAALALADESIDTALPILDALLGDKNWRVRKAAVESIITFPAEPVLPLLFRALYDSANAGKRNSAVEALIKEGVAALPHIYDNLVEGDVDVKLALITLLGEVPSRNSAPHLIYYLSHQDKNICSAAITSLGRLRDTGSLPVLLDIFKRQDDWLWFHLIDALSNIGGPVATTKLLELYDSRKFRKAVLKAMGHMADLRVIPFLMEKAAEPGSPLMDLMEAIGRTYHARIPAALLERHQAEMAQLIRKHFPMELVESLDDRWEEAKVEERRGMILIAGFLADLSLLDRVLSELENPYLQKDAFEAAAAYGKAATPFLVRHLNRTQSLGHKIPLIRLVGLSNGPDAIVPILNQAREVDAQIRMEALAALGELDDPRCLQELVSVLREQDTTFHETALRAIKRLARKYPSHKDRMGYFGRTMTEDAEEGVRRAGYTLLAESLGQDTAPLIPGLKDDAPAVRQTVVRLIARKMGASAFETLLPVLGDDSSRVRRVAISVLGRELLARQSETLMTLLADPDVWVRSEAACALAQSTDPSVGDALLSLLEEDVLPVKLGALRGLAEVGCGTLFPAVMKLALDDQNPLEVRRAAFAALARSGRPDGVRILEQALTDHRWEVRSSAIELMGGSNDHRYIPLLLKELERDPDPSVKQTVVQALIALRAAEAVPRMLNYLTDPVLKDSAYAFFLALGREHLRLIENEAQSVDFQTKLILIEILKQLESR